MARVAEPVMKTDVTGSGVPLVLVPGGLTGWLSWVPHAQKLSSSFRVIRVQLLNVEYGLQGLGLPAGYGVRTESRALELALDSVRVTQAHMSGWSYGGMILLDFALSHPDRVRSLTLIEPPAFWVLRTRAPLAEDALAFQETSRSFMVDNVTEEQLVQFAHFAGFVPPNIDPRNLPPWPVWAQHRQSLRTGDLAFRHEDDIERVRGFRKPVLLFKGAGSPSYLRSIIDILGEEFPAARMVELPGAHALPVISMDRYLEIFTSFIGE